MGPAAAVLSALLAAGPAQPCGLEDPGSVAMQRGALSLSYPQSLHVGTAIWQAQLAGRLPRDPVAQRDDLSPEARGALRLMRASVLLQKFGARLPDDASTPAVAVVLLGPVLWSRFEAHGGIRRAVPHVAGPELGDLVLVTDLAAVEAVTGGSLTMDEALQAGVMRLYGEAAQVARARAWFAQRARS